MSEQTQKWEPPSEPKVVSFGPYRAIGTRYVGRNEHNEIPAMWGNDFLPRMGEIKMLDDAEFSVGVCRCLSGSTDGAFEYIAAAPASKDAVVPEGMVEVVIPFGQYVAIPIQSLREIHQAWCHSGDWFGDHPEWTGYCNKERCECAQHPGFEYYPPEFDGQGPLYIYLPIQPTI